MLPSITANPAWPEPNGLALRLLIAFALVFALLWLGGRLLVEAVLPIAHGVLGWIDDRFAVLFLGLDHTDQDTVIRLRVNLIRMIIVGQHVVEPHPKGWLEVTTTTGAILQPLIIALGLSGAWPGRLRTRLLRLALAALFGTLFMLIDIPLTLYAYVWDMFLEHYDPRHISPLMIVHQFFHVGGRLGIGVLLAVLAVYGEARGGKKPIFGR